MSSYNAFTLFYQQSVSRCEFSIYCDIHYSEPCCPNNSVYGLDCPIAIQYYKSECEGKIFEIHIRLEMPRLSAVQREQAIGMLMGGISQPAVARHFNVAKSTVLRLVRRLEETGSTRDRPRPFQPRVTTPNQDRRIRLIHLRDRFQSAVQTAAIIPGRHNPRISAKTVYGVCANTTSDQDEPSLDLCWITVDSV